MSMFDAQNPSGKLSCTNKNSEMSVPMIVHRQEKKIRGPFKRAKASVIISMVEK